MHEVSLVVIAGGESRRMDGAHKALLPIPPHDKPLIGHVIDVLAPLCNAGTIVVANHRAIRDSVNSHLSAPVTIVSDLWPGTAAMGGMATGLMHCDGWALSTACDMPFVNSAIFALLAEIAGEVEKDGARKWDAVVPRVRAYPEMLHAAYHVSMVRNFRQCIEEGNLKLLDALPGARVRYVEEDEMVQLDPGLGSFTNVNTPEEWEKARQRLASQVGAYSSWKSASGAA